MGKVLETIALVLVIGMYLALPVITIWGWIRWSDRRQRSSASSILSVVGFTFATLSGALAIFSLVYAHAIGGFPFYDPLLMKMYGVGFLLSSAGILFSLGGVWRPNALRWHAPACSLGMLLFWFFSAMGE